MINALLLKNERQSLSSLKQKIAHHCPQINFCGTTDSTALSKSISETNPHLIFLEKGDCDTTCLNLLEKITSLDLETILIAKEKEFAFDAISYRVCSFLLKPIDQTALVKAVNKACRQIEQKEIIAAQRPEEQVVFPESKKIPLPNHQMERIGIPSVDGYEFIKISDIVRCEGLQKCTRVILSNKNNIISSYNIGEFRKKLEPYGFFATHKSHLINLNAVQKYHKEGSITMIDHSTVPVSRRRKSDFLGVVLHL